MALNHDYGGIPGKRATDAWTGDPKDNGEMRYPAPTPRGDLGSEARKNLDALRSRFKSDADEKERQAAANSPRPSGLISLEELRRAREERDAAIAREDSFKFVAGVVVALVLLGLAAYFGAHAEKAYFHWMMGK